MVAAIEPRFDETVQLMQVIECPTDLQFMVERHALSSPHG
jgi:hypothetical protein